MELLLDPQIWIAFATLAALEIVLGIDNIIFISILTGRLPAEQRARARFLGLGLAMLMRLVLLFSLPVILIDEVLKFFGRLLAVKTIVPTKSKRD